MNIMFSLIIPTFNSHKDLERLLASLALIKNELDRFEIIIIDDGSCDDTEIIIRRFEGQFDVLNYYYQKNKGPAAARNLGASKARGEYLIFIDDDCLVPKGCLDAIKDFYKSNSTYAGVGIKTVNSSKSVFSEFNQRLGDYLIEASHVSGLTYEYVSSRCYSFAKESFWSINGHDESFIWPAAEDRDFCLRFKEAKLKFAYLQTITVTNADHLRLKGFIRQNFLYGLGAGLLKEKNPYIFSVRLSRYKEMILRICNDRSFLRKSVLFSTFCLAQICTLIGLILYKINFHYKNRPPSVFLPRHAIFIEIIKNYVLGISIVKSFKKRSGSLTTGEEMFSVGYLSNLAQKTTDIYKDIILKTFQEENWLNGKKVLEIGPGSHLAIPLSFIAAGATKVVSIDKYGEVKFRQKEQQVYEKILSRLSDHKKANLTGLVQGLNLKRASDLDTFVLNYLPDLAIDSTEIFNRLSKESFDLIVSFNTLEHIKDIRIAFQNMKMLLKKDGIFIHKVDATSHYAISRYTKNSLAQLIFSDRVFDLMFFNRNAPTRRLLSDYQRISEDEGIPIIKSYVDELATTHEINSSFKFLYSRFKNYTQDEISKVGFIIVAQKK